MDLTVNLFGEDHFTPIIVAPIADQKRFHPDARAGDRKGRGGGQGADDRQQPLEHAARPDCRGREAVVLVSGVCVGCRREDAGAGRGKSRRESDRDHRRRVACRQRIRVATPASINWSAVDAIKQGVSVPVIVKGITTPAEATAALQHNVQGIIASNFGGLLANKDAMILALPNIVDAVGGKVPVLTDGSFRRGTDILKALAFGAQGVLIGRPVMWGLVGVRRCRRAGRRRDGSDRARALHGHVRQGRTSRRSTARRSRCTARCRRRPRRITDADRARAELEQAVLSSMLAHACLSVSSGAFSGKHRTKWQASVAA